MGITESSFNFIDLRKAYDTVNHKILWEKLHNIGIPQQFIIILKALYLQNSAKININGHFSQPITMERGIKQGCVLSPLLFIIYISDIAQFIQKDGAGVNLAGQIISGLFFVDDLVIIGRNRIELERLISKVVKMFHALGMEINCEKCNILSENQNEQNMLIESLEGEVDDIIV